MNTPGLLCGLLLAAAMIPVAAGPTVEFTEYLGPFVGEGAPLHPDNEQPVRIRYYGTDLGWSYEHQGRIQFLFGDTWAVEAYAPIEASTGSRFDDSFGSIDMADWPDPTLISSDNIPLIRLGQNPGTAEAAAIDPGHAMDLGKTPMAGFSNGVDEFAIFNVGKGQPCRSDAECRDGLSCDAELGYFGVPPFVDENLTLPCEDGAPGCNADTLVDESGSPVAGSGLCEDATSSIGRRPVSNVLTTMGFRTLVGLRSKSDPRKYETIYDWLTSKFVNVTVRAVNGFDPSAGRFDYRPTGIERTQQRVLLWGRPGFAGVNARDRRLALYFAWVDMPAGPGYRWKPHYYTGTVDGVPRFSTDQREAMPADLDATQPGIQPNDIYDIVDQMSIVWIEELDKWVMFYGGAIGRNHRDALPTCGVLQLFTGAECVHVDLDNGAFRMRTADHPWGPWSPPQDLIVAGDPAVPELQYGPGGALHQHECDDPACAPHTDTEYYQDDEHGFFYAPNIIEQWTRPVNGGVDVIWIASTWDPYRVIMLRTRIKK